MYNGGNRGGFGFPGLTPMVQRIMIVCGLVWIVQMGFDREGPESLTRILGVSPEGVFSRFYVWQPVTYMWLHDRSGFFHILFNMLALWMFGGQIEQVWGSRRFLRFYLTCGIGAGVIILLWNALTGAWGIPTLGASGAIYGLLTAFSLLWPDRTIMLLFPPIPIRALYFIPFLFVMNLIMVPGQNISHVGHLGGVIVAAFLMRDQLGRAISIRSVRYRWHRYRMRNRLRAVRREEWERRKRDDDRNRPTYH